MPMRTPLATKLYAALPTPFTPEGGADEALLNSVLDFAMVSGIDGFCIGGATGEYAASGVEERISIMRSAARRVNGRARLIFGVGAEHSGQVQRLARAAAECGGVAALLPPPSFFRLGPDELEDFLRETAAGLPLPVVLYNIPQFTAEVGLDRLLRLVREVPNVIGLKDSSGRRENLAAIQDAKKTHPMEFLIGSDELLLAALEHGADGAVSGTASACPELVLAIIEAFHSGRTEEAGTLQKLLDEFLSRIKTLPPPWAMKLVLRAHGVETGELNWPLRGRLREEAELLERWLPAWLAECDQACLKCAR